MNSSPDNNEGFLLLVIYNLLLLGYIFNRGFYTFGGVLIVFFVLVLLLIHLRFRVNLTTNKGSFPLLLKFSVLFSVVLSLIVYGGLYQNSQVIIFLSRWLLFLAVCLIFFYFLKIKGLLGKIFEKKFFALICIATVLRILMIISSPSPIIDVFVELKEGPLAFLHNFSNPYSIEYSQVYPRIEPNHYAYLPGTIYLMLIPDFLFKDPRVGILVAELIFAFVIFKIVKERETAQVLALLALFHPSALFILEQSFVDIVFVTLLAVYVFLKKTKFPEFVKGVALGFAFLIKLTFFALPLFLIRSNILNRKEVVWLIITISLIGLPFVLASPWDFFDDQVLYYIEPGRNSAPIPWSLNLNAFYLQNFQISLPNYLRVSVIFLISILILLWQKKTLEGMLSAFATFLTIFFFFGTQAFINYYYSVSLILLLVLAVSLNPRLK